MKSNKKTIALRFSDNFAPPDGTILEHQKMIDQNGFVWYGKLGNRISQKVANEIMSWDEPRILLIHSGKTKRYWVYISEIKLEIPDLSFVPEYYRNIASKFGGWFKIIRINEAPRDVLTNCVVASSGAVLGDASKHSMSPYFIINVGEKAGD
ncbi:hypothetical protein [Roseburia sp. AM16-25]|uniref:hypothetical protein n=1 Tax=Roseburia sp. AM16-25 TaxID=2292065 RepID=UPI000E4F5542|nr:hypothetical protein [Roseburia sp. AM16-25]RHO30990.1 hypothetical protein DW183_10125 [Roseburia sp. AM16-25]